MGSRRRRRGAGGRGLAGGLTGGRRRGGSSPDIDLHAGSSGSGNHSHSVSLSDTFQSPGSRDTRQRVRAPGPAESKRGSAPC